MTASTLLVDPLAALFRTELDGCPPLVIDSTLVDVTLLPPLAQVVVVRQFTNTTDKLVEAVLTLPPLGQHEVVFRLTVWIGGVMYDATPQSVRRGRRAHDRAVEDGRRAILYELLKHDIQMISIAGIEPGAPVEVQIWSIKPLGRPEQDRATLFIPLSARHDAVMAVLTDADALVTTPAHHVATLAVHAAGLQVSLCGQGNPYPVASGDPIRIDCAAPIQIEIVPEHDHSLDHSVWQVDQVGGWEVTSPRGIETFRHPKNPGGCLASDRSDWIFGALDTAQGEIRVTAPLPTEGIAPNARALRAFAAAGFAHAATPQDPDVVRRTANILSRQTCLTFIGPDGELPDDMLVMRKLALPEMLALEKTGAPPSPVGLEPFDYEKPAQSPEAALPMKTDYEVPPGNRAAPNAQAPRFHWLPWGVAAFALLLLSGVFQLMALELPPRLIAVLILLSVGAVASLPHDQALVRRRLPVLAILVIPWIAALSCGPLLDASTYGGTPPPGWMIPAQLSLLALSAILPVAVLPFMRGARIFALALGIFNFALTAFVTLSGVLVLSPD